jgi:hypothetical protein
MTEELIPFAAQLGMFAVMLGVSFWGWRSISPDYRFPVRFGGASGFQTTIGKHTGLLLWPVLGAIVLIGSTAAARGEGGSDAGAGWLGAAALAVLLMAQISAVRRGVRW